MHAAAPGAVDPPTLELNVKIPTCHTQVAGTEQAFVVAAAAAMAAVRAHRCFFRRRNDTIRIFGSPNSPLSVDAATTPGKENNSRRQSEEHTSEIQSLMRSSDSVFYFKKKKKYTTYNQQQH